ncbi:hypothetical protein OGR47_03185 [Methylocystis sp. MJC1]|jgi:hypothetical protein|uniref:HMA2 domain-containing protein n=1 Tax=Methylocystis sp. MJC1 TaxID=2654282 RepID=UPI0013EBC1FB|nr:hypothetical protein [Methylocystis sp. MJC1]MBU6526018.1 hypothetical protein [Methylocystis sp. MJC1]UZX12485.1 hypothetical protein OGR47_03185 [Methylocystis sp. MJC1]
MVLHLHHVPGRLRVCLAKLIGDSRAIIPLHSALLAVPGVRSASINAHTGSVTVLYHRNDFDLEAFWGTLRRQGCLSDPSTAEPAVSSRRDSVAAGAASAVGEALASAVVKHLFDRSALSLVKLLV